MEKMERFFARLFSNVWGVLAYYILAGGLVFLLVDKVAPLVIYGLAKAYGKGESETIQQYWYSIAVRADSIFHALAIVCVIAAFAMMISVIVKIKADRK